jgi:glycosyltransferase involved in cell wall biosynthesis
MIKNKICHLTSVHPAKDIRIYYKQCISLHKAGYDVALIAPHAQITESGTIPIIPIKLPGNRFFKMMWVTFAMYFKALRQSAKLYHFHDPELMFCGVLLRLSGKKVVFDIHENVRLSIVSKTYLPKYLKSPLAYVYYGIERFCLLFFNHLVLAEESYQKYYPKQKSTIVLNMPIRTDVLEVEKAKNPIRIVYTGVVHPVRGLWEMLQLVKELNAKEYLVQFDLVGEIRPATEIGKVAHFIKKHNLHDVVNVHGKVDYSKVSGFLGKAHIGLSLLHPIPNYQESLPTKIFEYMQHGLAVITNDFPLYKKYVEAENTGVCVNISNGSMIQEKVEYLINNESVREEMAKNGIFATQHRHNWTNEEKKLLQLYASLLNQ